MGLKRPPLKPQRAYLAGAKPLSEASFTESRVEREHFDHLHIFCSSLPDQLFPVLIGKAIPFKMTMASVHALARNSKITTHVTITIDRLLTRYAISTSNTSTLSNIIRTTDVTMLSLLIQLHFGVSKFKAKIPSYYIMHIYGFHVTF